MFCGFQHLIDNRLVMQLVFIVFIDDTVGDEFVYKRVEEPRIEELRCVLAVDARHLVCHLLALYL